MRDLLTALRREFPEASADTRPPPVETVLRWGAQSAPALTAHPATAPGTGFRVGAGTGAQNWLVWLDGTWDGSALSLSRGYVTAKVGSVVLTIGREAQRWGGSPRTSLILTEHAGALDLLRLSFEVPRVRFSKFGTQLSSHPTRYLVGTRVDWMVSDRLRIGFSELAVAQPSSLLYSKRPPRSA